MFPIRNGGSNRSQRIVDVWAHNLEEEFEKMMKVLEQYQYVAMDTEFPGIVIGDKSSRYKELRCNVDALRLIQLGLSFSNDKGESPDMSCWQFNFDFDVHTDLHAADSIELLHRAGLDFRKHKDMGIDPHRFGEMLMQSGMVLSDQVHWVCFHGCYDFAYLIKVLSGAELPQSRGELLELCDLFFPKRTDVKLLAKTQGNFGSLASIAEQRELCAAGLHQGGFDAMLTRDVFFSLPDGVRSTAFSGDLFGLQEDESKDVEPGHERPEPPPLTAASAFSEWDRTPHGDGAGWQHPRRYEEPVQHGFENPHPPPQPQLGYPQPPRSDFGRGYGRNDGWGNDGYGGRNDYGRNDYGRNEYRRNDYRNDYRSDYRHNDYRNDYRGDYRPDYLQSGPGDHYQGRYPNWAGDGYRRQAVF
jgi:CCR4-NOT transcription complex subunit 7/8